MSLLLSLIFSVLIPLAGADSLSELQGDIDQLKQTLEQTTSRIAELRESGDSQSVEFLEALARRIRSDLRRKERLLVELQSGDGGQDYAKPQTANEVISYDEQKQLYEERARLILLKHSNLVYSFGSLSAELLPNGTLKTSMGDFPAGSYYLEDRSSPLLGSYAVESNGFSIFHEGLVKAAFPNNSIVLKNAKDNLEFRMSLNDGMVYIRDPQTKDYGRAIIYEPFHDWGKYISTVAESFDRGAIKTSRGDFVRHDSYYFLDELIGSSIFVFENEQWVEKTVSLINEDSIQTVDGNQYEFKEIKIPQREQPENDTVFVWVTLKQRELFPSRARLLGGAVLLENNRLYPSFFESLENHELVGRTIYTRGLLGRTVAHQVESVLSSGEVYTSRKKFLRSFSLQPQGKEITASEVKMGLVRYPEGPAGTSCRRSLLSRLGIKR